MGDNIDPVLAVVVWLGSYGGVVVVYLRSKKNWRLRPGCPTVVFKVIYSGSRNADSWTLSCLNLVYMDQHDMRTRSSDDIIQKHGRHWMNINSAKKETSLFQDPVFQR